MRQLEEPVVLDERIGDDFRGFAPGVHGRRLRELLDADVSLFDGTFSPPVMVLKHRALQHNIDTMAAWCRARGVELAPHGKTTLAPQLFDRQLAAGAWGITVATPEQVRLAGAAGAPRVLLANELVDPVAIAWIIAEMRDHPDQDFLCYVDSVAGVRLLEEGLRAAGPGRPFDVLLEIGPVGGRTGVRTANEARRVAEAASTVQGLRVVGVAGYEGGIGHDINEEVIGAVRNYLRFVHDTAGELAAEGLIENRGGGIILSAGGSIFFDDVVVELTRPLRGGHASTCIIRPGAYVSHDSGLYARLSPFTRPGADPATTLIPAFEAWGHVLSMPEQGLAIASIGRRDVPTDQGLPIPLRIRKARADAMIDARACTVTQLNDQHAFVSVPSGVDIEVGDWLSVGISHPCTTFDRWRLLPEVDENDRVVDFIRTYF